ncbi:PAS domain-containing protein [Vibrio sp. PP-XX7]
MDTRVKIDVAIFAFNEKGNIAFVNQGAGLLFERAPKSMQGELIDSLEINDLLQCESGSYIKIKKSYTHYHLYYAHCNTA